MRHSGSMSGYRNAFLLTVFLALASVAALSQSPPAASSDPLTVTTDTPAYCNDLAARIRTEQQTHPSAQPEVQTLAEEGQHMCDHGLIRGGLIRLRRAWLMLEGKK